MRRPETNTVLFAGLFALALAAALAVMSVSPGRLKAKAPAAGGFSLRSLWRVQMPARPNAPCAFSGGWIVSDAAGGVSALSSDGKRLWQASFSNEAFEAGASVLGGRAFVAHGLR